MLLAKEIFCKLCLHLTLSGDDCKLLSSKELASSSSIALVCGDCSGSCSFAFVARLNPTPASCFEIASFKTNFA